MGYKIKFNGIPPTNEVHYHLLHYFIKSIYDWDES